jgi:hypothetical protein
MDVVVRAVVLVKDLGGTLGDVRKELESRGILECEVDFSGVAEVKGDTVLRAETINVARNTAVVTIEKGIATLYLNKADIHRIKKLHKILN